ncbi:MAG: hypothetical protein HY898_26855 [Deltaproteobacteria bacterium]|nr:hypothetical protein [Deltaproteobacteria bacterium]
MQKTRLSIVASGALLTWLLAAACGGPEAPPVKSPADLPSASGAEVPTTPPATAPTAVTPPPTTSSVAIAPPTTGTGPTSTPEAPADRMTAPLVLRLKGPDPVPAKGDVKLDLEIVTNEAINGPVTLKIALPKGATLKTGKAEEVLQISQAGTQKREFVVSTTATLASPIIVTADTKDPKGNAGLHAERKYPETTGSVTPGSTTPKPPVPRPPGPPR